MVRSSDQHFSAHSIILLTDVATLRDLFLVWLNSHVEKDKSPLEGSDMAIMVRKVSMKYKIF